MPYSNLNKPHNQRVGHSVTKGKLALKHGENTWGKHLGKTFNLATKLNA
jgi:hypothetical protein